jgi:hypothetical protein
MEQAWRCYDVDFLVENWQCVSQLWISLTIVQGQRRIEVLQRRLDILQDRQVLGLMSQESNRVANIGDGRLEKRRL